MMFIIIGIDALEKKLVDKFNCSNLKQKNYGLTDISEYEQPRTLVLWSSFLAGKNLEKKIVSLGNKKMWNFKLKKNQTFLAKFKKTKALDVPGYTYNKKQHGDERQMLRDFFEGQISIEEFDRPVFGHFRKIKKQFLKELKKNYDILMVYFDVADVIGHLSFANSTKMKMIYQDLDQIAQIASNKADKLLIISDHGMKPVGKFGDHDEKHGFWSTNFKFDLKNPKITDFAKIIINT